MITKLKKEKQIQLLSENIKKAQAGFLVNFQGLNVEQMTEIRKLLKNEGCADIKICRNTLFRKAMADYPEVKEHFSSNLTGSNAFVFAFDNPSKVAKILSDYVEKTEVLKIKTGVLDGKGMSLEDIKALAKLPSIEVLKAQFLGILSAPMSKLLSIFSVVPQGLLSVLASYKDKVEKK